jgi:3-mercaptopyruvate sulfurtransferase SseA
MRNLGYGARFVSSRQAQNQKNFVIDSSTPDWLERGTIPGAINIPWDRLNIGKSDLITVRDILEKHLGVVNQDGFCNFENATTRVMFCNGSW